MIKYKVLERCSEAPPGTLLRCGVAHSLAWVSDRRGDLVTGPKVYSAVGEFVIAAGGFITRTDGDYLEVRYMKHPELKNAYLPFRWLDMLIGKNSAASEIAEYIVLDYQHED